MTPPFPPRSRAGQRLAPTSAGTAPTLTRRQLLTPRPAAGAGQSSQLSASVPGTAAPAGPQASAGGPQSKVDLDRVLAHHASQGFTLELLDEIRAMGREAWIDQQLQPGAIADPVSDNFVRDFITVPMSIAELQAGYTNSTIAVVEELQQACVGRTVLSERQLYERVVEFWHDHFNIDQLETIQGRLYFTHYDRTVIRQKALGSFEDLLVATAKSAAMLSYLDGDVNIVGAANENYAREVMELHTLGVDGPYTENDVQELARCLTGWRYEYSFEANPGDFFFDAANHDFGAKTVLGFNIPAGGGESDALTLLHELAIHPKTLDYVSRKLVSWLVAYDPPQAAIDLVVARWQATSGDMREVVREALSDEVLLLCDAAAAGKLKRPYHFGSGLLRQLGAVTTDGYLGAARIFSLVGQRPYVWGPPDGYPDTIAAWGADTYGRWNFATSLLAGFLPGTSVPTANLVALQGNTPPEALAKRLAQALSGGLMDAGEVARVQAYIDSRPFDESVLRDAVALLASCPSYQFY